MIASVSLEETRWAQSPAKFEAGTSNIAEAIGLGAAVDFLQGIGMEHVRDHERELVGLRARAPARDRRASRSTARPTPRTAARSSPSRSRASTRTTSPRSSAARASACAPATTARSRSCSASASAPRRARPSACTTPARTSTRSIAGLAQGPGGLRLMDDLYREEILEHYKRPHNWGPMEAPDLEFADNNPLCGDELTVMLRVDDDGTDRGRPLRRPRLRDQPGGGVDGLRRGQGHEGRRPAAPRPRRSCSTCSGSTSPRRA